MFNSTLYAQHIFIPPSLDRICLGPFSYNQLDNGRRERYTTARSDSHFKVIHYLSPKVWLYEAPVANRSFMCWRKYMYMPLRPSTTWIGAHLASRSYPETTGLLLTVCTNLDCFHQHLTVFMIFHLLLQLFMKYVTVTYEGNWPVPNSELLRKPTCNKAI